MPNHAPIPPRQRNSSPYWCQGAAGTIGGGFETALEGVWTAKLEYLYFDIGAVNLTTPPGSGIGANTWNVETDGSVVRAGINYRFSFKIGY